jgi:hypothetical protein
MGRRGKANGDTGYYNREKPLLDRLMEYLTSNPKKELEDMELTDEDARILERLQFIDSLLRRHRPKIKKQDIINMTVRRYSISERQFHVDYSNCQKLFGNVNPLDRKYLKTLYSEWLEQIASLAESKGDYKSAVLAIEKAAQIHGLYEKELAEDSGKDNPGKFVMVMMLQDGNVKTADLDALSKMPEAEYQELIDVTTIPTTGVDEMSKLLEDGE